MTAQIIKFPRKESAVVQMLEHQLALAKEGKIKFIAFAAVNEQNHGYSGWAPDDEIGQAALTAAIGSVAFMNARFMESVLEGAVNHDDTPDAA